MIRNKVPMSHLFSEPSRSVISNRIKKIHLKSSKMLGKEDLLLKYKELISNYCTGADFQKLEIGEIF